MFTPAGPGLEMPLEKGAGELSTYRLGRGMHKARVTGRLGARVWVLNWA